MNNNFVNQFSGRIKFSYTCFDRVIIRGYIRKFFRIGSLICLLRLMGIRKVSDTVFRSFTDRLNLHITKESKKHGIPLHWWRSVNGGTNGAKLRYVAKHHAKRCKGKGNFTYCILTDNENVQTFASREFFTKAGKKHRKIYKVKKPVKHYYIYFHDRVLGGPCYLKLCSYFPFTCQFYFNGHNYVRHRLDQLGISYTMRGNAFTSVSDPDTLQTVAKAISGSMVQQRIHYWMNRFFKFDHGKYSTRSKYFKHEWYMGQVEICSNVIFKSARYCTNLFDRLIDKFHRLGMPDSISRIFNKRSIRRHHSKTTCRLYEDNACLKHWFRRNALKLYNKLGYLLRIETVINNPQSLGSLNLKKPLAYLHAYLWAGLSCNNRFLNCCADVDTASIANSEPERFTQPVMNDRGHKVTPPDLRKARQTVLLKELLKPKYSTSHFTTRELLPALQEYFRNTAQIRYEMQKLIARNVIKKLKNKSFYIVTSKGWQWMWVAISSISHFRNPIISKIYKKEIIQSCAQPSKIEEVYDLINHALTQFTQEMAMII